jgi:hypothetical protein
MKYIKITILNIMLLSSFTYAKESIQPIIHGKIYPSFRVSLNEFGQPNKINKGGVDHCNDSFFPDQYVYKDFTLLDRGLVYEVILNQKNGLIFYNQRIDLNTKKSTFLKQFQDIVQKSSENLNEYYAESEEDATTQITFIFNGEKLVKYKIIMNDC